MKLKELFESTGRSVADLKIDYKGGDFYCAHNKLTSLKDVHKHIAEIKGIFYAIKNPIESHVLGLLLIKVSQEYILITDKLQKS